MSNSILHRDILGAELRADDSGRRIYGVVVPDRQVAAITESDGSRYDEMFVRGCFDGRLSNAATK